jgi:hypothetical protein
VRSPWGVALRADVARAAATAFATTQQPLAQLRQAETTAPVAVRHRWLGGLDRGGVVARDRRRAGRQQITRRRRGGTLMRYYFSLPRPMAAGTLSTVLPTRQGVLVAAASFPQALAARLPGADPGAVNLAAVAPATDDHLAAAPPAQEQTGRNRLGLLVVAAAA